jgi:pimeloyl-[acyl-carrier protein] methyl ester esterase
MKSSLLLITGWAHGPEAVQPMADKLASEYDVRILTGTQVLQDQFIPSVDYIVTGSMGGLLAMELLPKTCKKLVLISSTAKFCEGDGYPCGTPEKILRRMILQLKRYPDAVLKEFFKNVHFPNRQSRQAVTPCSDSTEDLVAGLEYLLTTDLRLQTPTLSIPVLLLHGADDRIIPSAASEWLHKNLPDSRLKIYKNDGHALPAHQFGEVMAEISTFL